MAVASHRECEAVGNEERTHAVRSLWTERYVFELRAAAGLSQNMAEMRFSSTYLRPEVVGGIIWFHMRRDVDADYLKNITKDVSADK